MNRSTFLRLCCFSLVQVLVGKAAIAQLPTNDLDRLEPIIFAAPTPADNSSPTQPRHETAKRRPPCRLAEKPLTALVPVYSVSGGKLAWGVTINAQPTLWVYVPYALSNATAEFVLENAARQSIVRQVPLAAKPGIMAISLADLDLSLEENQSYNWYFEISCQGSNQRHTVPDAVEGKITRRRMNPTVSNQVTQTNDLHHKVKFFAQAGIWHEALSIAAVLHCARSQSSSWVQLLQATGFQDLIQEQIVVCPNPQSF
jgi:hypothetical protein